MFPSNYIIWDGFKVHMGLRSEKVKLNSRVMVGVNYICSINKGKDNLLLVLNMFHCKDKL